MKFMIRSRPLSRLIPNLCEMQMWLNRYFINVQTSIIVMQYTIILIFHLIHFTTQWNFWNKCDDQKQLGHAQLIGHYSCATLFKHQDCLGTPLRIPDTQFQPYPVHPYFNNRVESLIVKAGCILMAHTDWRCFSQGQHQSYHLFRAPAYENLLIDDIEDSEGWRLYKKISCVKCQCFHQ